MKKITPLLAIVFLWSCSTIKTSQLDSATASNTNGFYYALPKTILIASFEIEKKTVEKGKYSEYAPCFDIELEETVGTSYKVKNMEMTSRSMLDKNKVYQMNMSRNFLNKNDFALEYSKEGELTSSDIKNESQIVPLISTVVNYATLIPGIAALGNEPIVSLKGLCNDLADKKYKLAKESYDRILVYQSMQKKILENSDGSNKEAVEFKLQKINQLKEEQLSDFTGKITTKTIKIQFEIDPENMDEIGNGTAYHKILLFSIDKAKGIQLAPEFSNYVSTGFESNEITAPSETFYIQLQKIEKGIGEVIAKNNNKDTKKASFYYNIPAEARFQIVKEAKGTSTIAKQADLMVPQCGIVAAGPSNMKNMVFKLHPGLGSLLSISGTTATVDLEKLNAAPEKLSGLLDKLKKEEPEDPKDKLIKQLEQDVKIKELQDKLNAVSE